MRYNQVNHKMLYLPSESLISSGDLMVTSAWKNMKWTQYKVICSPNSVLLTPHLRVKIFRSLKASKLKPDQNALCFHKILLPLTSYIKVILCAILVHNTAILT